MQPTFSIIHTSARPDAWQASHDAWLQNASDPASVEYILAYDPRWGFPENYTYPGVITVQNMGRKCSVDGWNTAVKLATGKVLLINSDDMFPCQDWDHKLLEVIPDLDGEYVVETSSNTPADTARTLVFQVLTRQRLEQVGYLFWHEYECMSCDSEFTEHARLDGVVIDARHIVIEHRHYTVKGLPHDGVYSYENRPEVYQLGFDVIARRRSRGFPKVVV